MITKIKFWVGKILVSDFVFRLLIKRQIRNGVIRTKNGFLSVKNQSTYIQALIFWDIYENPERRAIRKYLRKDTTIIELGASLGVVTLALCKWIDGKQKIYSVEANPKLLPNLLQTKSLNQLHTLEIINSAIDYSGNKTISFSIDANNLGSSKESPEGQTNSNALVTVEAMPLHDLISKYDIGEYVLVSDIEGAEVEILVSETDARVFENCKQIVFELHQTSYKGKQYTQQNLADLVVEKFNMQVLYQSGNIWVFGK
ncbi:MAG: FkbM family methyltransferase [Bacteroidetes bacterium]|nr:FkbM family methyltransferase [Bacteroidota bacterium]